MNESADETVSARDRALETLAAAERLLVALDFDGTISYFTDPPEAARPIPVATRAVVELKALTNTWVAYVSGRGLDSLSHVTGAGPDELLVGSHGVEARLGGRLIPVELEPSEQQTLSELKQRLEALVATVPGALVEVKPAGFAIHGRRVVGSQLAEELETRARQVVRQFTTERGIPALLERSGKQVVEFTVREATKGDGLRTLRHFVSQELVTLLYAGDDVTDEDAFAALESQDVGIKIGEGTTLASLRVADPDELGAVLRDLATRRAARQSRDLIIGRGK